MTGGLGMPCFLACISGGGRRPVRSWGFDRAWIFFFFAFSDFCVYFAVFFWCPFHRIIIRPSCCMECRIFNWDSFFSYSFLLFLPSVYSIILVGLALCSLVEWEITYHKYPKRFYRMSNQKLTCENCDLEACKTIIKTVSQNAM